MRRTAWVVGLVALGAGVAGAGSAELKRVAGKATMSRSICGGGVAITREEIEQLPPPYPLGGKEFLVVAGDRISARRPAARFVTQADGTFVTRLPPGTWCFFEAGRRPTEPAGGPVAAPGPNIDGDCLENERRRCDLTLVVKSDVKRAHITFAERCPQPWAQPCYHGPMPP